MHYSPPIELGSRVETCSTFCRGPECFVRSKRIANTSGVHFLCDCSSLTHALPAPTQVTTIAIQPTLAILNAIPLGLLGLRYTTAPEQAKYVEARGTKGLESLELRPPRRQLRALRGGITTAPRLSEALFVPTKSTMESGVCMSLQAVERICDVIDEKKLAWGSRTRCLFRSLSDLSASILSI